MVITKSKDRASEPGEAVAALQAFAEILEQSSRAVVVIELSGALPYANLRFSELTGYSRAEIAGLTVFDLGARPQEAELGMWEAVSAGRMWQGQIPGRRKNGEQFWASAFVAPIADGNGEIAFYLAAFDEVPAPAAPTFPVDMPPDLVLLADTEGAILYVYQTAPVISAETAPGDTIFSCVPPDYRKQLQNHVDQVVRTKRPVTYEIPCVGPDGAVSWYVTQVGPLERRGEVVALSFITADLARRAGDQPPPAALEAGDLSRRELEVLKLLAQGLTNRQVAKRLRVSQRTIDHHVSHILNKLSAPNRTAAAMAARRTGLL